MVSKAHSTKEFIHWFKAFLSDAEEGASLPSGRALAARWGLSEATIRRALAPLARDGAITRIAGKGSFVGVPAVAPETIEAPVRAFESVAGHITELIRSGRLKRGQALPQQKWVCAMFHVTPETVRKAYRMLADDSLVTRFGKNYYVGVLPILQHSGNRKIVHLFQYRYNYRGLFKDNHAAPAYWRMEEELIRYGYTLVFHKGTEIEKYVGDWMQTGSNLPSGLICTEPRIGEYRGLSKLLQGFSSFMPPDFPILAITEAAPEKPHGVSIVNTGNLTTVVARSIAQRCIELGKKSLTLHFDPLERSPFSFLALLKIRTELKHINPALPFLVTFAGEEKSRDEFFYWFHRKRSSSKISMIINKYAPGVFDAITEETLGCETLEKALHAVPEQSLWVFRRDETARSVFELAKQRNREVPADLSLISLENDPSWFACGISACIPDWGTLGYLMAHVLIGDIKVEKTSRGYIRTPALMLTRYTG